MLFLEKIVTLCIIKIREFYENAEKHVLIQQKNLLYLTKDDLF